MNLARVLYCGVSFLLLEDLVVPSYCENKIRSVKYHLVVKDYEPHSYEVVPQITESTVYLDTERGWADTMTADGRVETFIVNRNIEWDIRFKDEPTKRVSMCAVTASSNIPAIVANTELDKHSLLFLVLASFTLIGEEILDSKKYKKYESSNNFAREEIWVSEEEGLVKERKRYQKREGAEVLDKVEEFSDYELNPVINDPLFEYTPVGGAKLKEFIETKDGEFYKKESSIPYTVPTSEEMNIAKKALEAVRGKFDSVKQFTASYTRITQGGMSEVIEGFVTKKMVQKGTLKVIPYVGYRWDFTETIFPQNIAKKKFVILHGDTFYQFDGQLKDGRKPVWIRYGSRPELPIMKVIRWLESFGIFAPVERRKAEFEEETSVYSDHDNFVPPYLLKPFDKMNTSSMKMIGVFPDNDPSQQIFELLPASHQRGSRHWIGIDDGIVRKIEMDNWSGAQTETVMTLENVTANSGFPISDIEFKNDGSFRLLEKP